MSSKSGSYERYTNGLINSMVNSDTTLDKCRLEGMASQMGNEDINLGSISVRIRERKGGYSHNQENKKVATVR